MRPSRRFHLLLPGELEAELLRFARQRGLPLAAALRQLATQALVGDAAGAVRTHEDSALGMAALLAAEHAVLMVASVLPEGQRRMQELGAQAAAAAEERLALVKESVP